MTVGPEYPSACVSHIGTPLRAWAPFTTNPASSGATPVYEYTLPAAPRVATSSITTVNAGLAVADPVIVGWKVEDLQLFPSGYATSVAKKIGLTLPSSTTSSSSLPLSPTNPGDLSTATKAGIGVGLTLGAAIIAFVIVVLVLRKQKKRKIAMKDPGIPEMGDQDHGHTTGKFFIGGRWRTEAHAEGAQNELDSTLVHEVSVTPAELDSTEVPVETEIGVVVGTTEQDFSHNNRETASNDLAI